MKRLTKNQINLLIEIAKPDGVIKAKVSARATQQESQNFYDLWELEDRGYINANRGSDKASTTKVGTPTLTTKGLKKVNHEL